MPKKSLLYIFCTLYLISTLQAQFPNPPNTIKFDALFYVDKSEVANIHWLEYLHYIKEDSSAQFYASSLPDTTLIIKIFPNGEILNNANYIKNVTFRYFPLVGVSYEQAANYCKWRSVIVTNKWSAEKILNTKKYKLNYRLPTVNEWIKIAAENGYNSLKPTDTEIVESLTSRDSTIKMLYNQGIFADGKVANKAVVQFYEDNPIHFFENLAYNTTDRSLIQLLPIKLPTSTRGANANYIYDLRGNVSEITATEGIAKGGNWKSKPGEIGLMDNVRYQYPSELIGFRCVCEIIEKE